MSKTKILNVDDNVSEFINDIKNIPTLYDASSTNYVRSDIQSRAWRDLGLKYGLTAYACQRQWKILRVRYLKEKKKIENSCSGNKLWKHYNNMSFINQYAKRCKRDMKPKSTSSADSIKSNHLNVEPKKSDSSLKQRTALMLNNYIESPKEEIIYKKSSTQSISPTSSILSTFYSKTSDNKNKEVEDDAEEAIEIDEEQEEEEDNGSVDEEEEIGVIDNKTIHKELSVIKEELSVNVFMENAEKNYTDMIVNIIQTLPEEIRNQTKLEILTLVAKLQIYFVNKLKDAQ